MPKKSKEKIEETAKKETSKKKTIKKKLSQLEFEKKVVELAEKGLTAEKIGEELRKQEIHPKEYSKKISKILKEKKIYSDPDMANIEKKLERVKKHLEKNKQDKRAKREKDRLFSQLRKLKIYNKIPTK